MCLNPRRMYNPQKRISKLGGQMFSLEVPCGECAECKEQMRTSWYFRSYYHCKEIYNKNGYVYFDTLTYDNDNLPHVKDIVNIENEDLNFPCFNVKHYRRFFMDLRQYFARNGYKDVNMSYFLTTEYGLNPKDGKTYRPHYHVLFFIDNSNSNNKLDPYTLSFLVSKYWKYGRTDGLPYKSYDYVKKHVFGKCYTRDFVHMRAVCNYVSKYVTKDTDFQTIIQERLGKLFDELDNMSYSSQRKVKDNYKLLKRSVDQFHRQSHHFGEYFLHDPETDFKEVTRTGMMSMPDKNSIVKHTPLCNYYLRKMFYVKKKSRDGSDYWTLSETGKVWKLERWLKSLELMEKRFNELYTNISTTNKVVIDDYLSGRTFRDFAIYLLFYKGKTRYLLRQNKLMNYEENCLHPFERDLSSWVQHLLHDVNELDDSQVLFHYASQSDRLRFEGCCFVTSNNLGNKDAGYIYNMPQMYYGYDDLLDKYYGDFVDAVHRNFIAKKVYGDCIKDTKFERLYCINQNTDKRFNNFDNLLSFINKLQMVESEKKQETFDYKESLRKKIKILTKSSENVYF